MKGFYGGYKIEYYENGRIKGGGDYIGKMEDGQKKGKWVYFYDNGQLEREGEYQNFVGAEKGVGDKYSVKIGEWKYYDKNGGIIKTEIYNNNE